MNRTLKQSVSLQKEISYFVEGGGGIQERIFKTLIFKCLLRILYINHKKISSAEFLFLCTYINKIGYIRFGIVF